MTSDNLQRKMSLESLEKLQQELRIVETVERSYVMLFEDVPAFQRYKHIMALKASLESEINLLAQRISLDDEGWTVCTDQPTTVQGYATTDANFEAVDNQDEQIKQEILNAGFELRTGHKTKSYDEYSQLNSECDKEFRFLIVHKSRPEIASTINTVDGLIVDNYGEGAFYSDWILGHGESEAKAWLSAIEVYRGKSYTTEDSVKWWKAKYYDR